MPTIDEMFPSKYLKATEIQGKQISAVVERIAYEEMQDGEMKYVVYFQKAKKGIVLNKTNAERLAEVYGPRTDMWLGKSVIIFTEKTKNPAGMTVQGLRMRAPDGIVQTAHVKAADTEDPAAEMDDAIPF